MEEVRMMHKCLEFSFIQSEIWWSFNNNDAELSQKDGKISNLQYKTVICKERT